MNKKIFASVLFASLLGIAAVLMSSSHREAPMLLHDPVADNTDVYAFRSPDNDSTITLIANFIPFQLPHGGPNYYQFGGAIEYNLHIDNNAATPGDDIVYRFKFYKKNEDPSTFFNIRLGKENRKTTYDLIKITRKGGAVKIVEDGIVPPYNVGTRSIESPVGLNESGGYKSLMDAAVTTATTGEKVFAGPVDDPFFVDLGGIFDLGDAPRQNGAPRDGLKCKNVSTIALQIPISTLQKDRKNVSQAKNILDSDFIIGVWASVRRRSVRTLVKLTPETHRQSTQSDTGTWVQVSRLGMPLTNEVVIPIGYKDYWNSLSPYQDLSKLSSFSNFFYNPELALYMDERQGFFGGAVPAFAPLDIQPGFRNGEDGLFGLKNTPALDGTALGIDAFENLLLPGKGKPRSVDLYPIFHTGVPNLRPYQLATGKKDGNPLAEGKPFINNFLPNGGDMLRLNMAVPATPRNSPDFNSLGLVWAAVLGLTDTRYNQNKDLQAIPNMDGFPNGRRLEDDVTRIELQAVSGIVLAAIGIPYPEGDRLGKVLGYTTGVENNDVAFQSNFPYLPVPHSGTGDCSGESVTPGNTPAVTIPRNNEKLNMSTPEIMLTAAPNPVVNNTTIRYHVAKKAQVKIAVLDATGKEIRMLVNNLHEAGNYTITWNATNLPKGTYYIAAIKKDGIKNTISVIKK